MSEDGVRLQAQPPRDEFGCRPGRSGEEPPQEVVGWQNRTSRPWTRAARRRLEQPGTLVVVVDGRIDAPRARTLVGWVRGLLDGGGPDARGVRRGRVTPPTPMPSARWPGWP